jgi:hypothetical protein
MTVPLAFAPLAFVPLEPDGEKARDWLLGELAKPPYQAARPTLFDTVAQAIRDWLVDLFSSGDGTVPNIVPVLVVLVLAAALVAAFFLFGLPRLNRRGAAVGELFGDDDRRSADALRVSASAAAARGDFALAIEDLYRSLARGLAERTVVRTTPGTTARDFARRAGEAFPAHASALSDGATAFDAVRYLGREGTREQYEGLAELERALRTERPAVLEPVATPAGSGA